MKCKYCNGELVIEQLQADRDKWLNQTIEDSNTIARLQTEIERLKHLLGACEPFIKADAAQHGGKLAYEITQALNGQKESE